MAAVISNTISSEASLIVVSAVSVAVAEPASIEPTVIAAAVDVKVTLSLLVITLVATISPKVASMSNKPSTLRLLRVIPLSSSI